MMVVTTRSRKFTEPYDPTLFADDGDLWTFYNHPERWQQTFYTNCVDSYQEEGEIIGNEESTAAEMRIDDDIKDGDPNVERDGSALFKGNEMGERYEDPMEADGTFAGDISDPKSIFTGTRFEKSFAAFVEDVETQGERLRSNSADSSIDLGGTEDEGTDKPQSDSADDKAQNETLDPSIEKEKYTCTCTHCGGSGHNRISCKNLHLPPEYICTRCGGTGHSRKTCRAENPSPTICQSKYLCTYCGKKGHGRQACQELYLPPKCVCPRCGEKGHSQKQCPQRNPNKDKPNCTYCDEYGHYRNLCPNSHLPPKYVCPRCGELGHSRKGCPRVGEPRKCSYVCRHCGEDGHAVNNCPQVVREKAPERCSYCKGIGHRRNICPSRPCRHCQATNHRPSSCPIYKAKRNRQMTEARKRRKLKKESAKKGLKKLNGV